MYVYLSIYIQEWSYLIDLTLFHSLTLIFVTLLYIPTLVHIHWTEWEYNKATERERDDDEKEKCMEK